MASTPHREVMLARRFLEQHYDAPISIDDLSREVALSPFYLIRSFRDVYNQTPYQYLVMLRITRAKELLRNSDLSITDICIAVGYESLGSFSTLFRKATGISPRTYRDNSTPTKKPQYMPFCISYRHQHSDTTSASK